MTATNVKTRLLELNPDTRGFVSKLMGGKREDNYGDVKLLRSLLSKEKAKILYKLKTEKINSIYELAKMLERDFKSVRQDLKLLERFGFIEFKPTKRNGRKALIPNLVINKIELIINI